MIDFLENAHKFIKRTKNSSPSDYNLTRESLISLSAYLCLLYLASDHFTGFTNSNPTTPYQEKIGSFSFFQGNSWKRRRRNKKMTHSGRRKNREKLALSEGSTLAMYFQFAKQTLIYKYTQMLFNVFDEDPNITDSIKQEL